MKLIVCGGREYADRAAEFAALDKVHKKTPISLLIHGACVRKGSSELSGADRWAEEWARENEVPYLGIPARWTTEGDSAGPKRNRRMARILGVEGVVALPGGDGTNDMCIAAEERSLKTWRPYG